MLTEAHATELDTGPRRSGTERYCALTREVKPTDQMIRFVVGPDGVVPDIKHKLPGRGLWLTATRECIAEAVARKTFARNFKRDVRVPQDLVDMTDKLLVRAALDALSIAGKAGAIAAGFAKTEAALARETVIALINAADAGADGVSKLKSALWRRSDADQVAIIAGFSTAQLDLALARSNVVHAALLAGSSSDTFVARYARLERFRVGDKDRQPPRRTKT
jgi:predicted RNA-binding protein YlxR (DUF448 family)